MKITYDAEADALSIVFAETTVTRALKKYQATGEGLKGEQRSRFWMIAKEDAEQWMPPRPRKKEALEG